ncbi:MAG TPA: glycosyltransferase [Phycisphaerae bacterium]|nr:glycosyltransferase [Phycisphaerae bacterium]HRW52148.1 glycosyltransferase [Phycisphaerae bacterium]
MARMTRRDDNEEESTTRPTRRILFVFEKFPPFTVSGSWRPFFFAKHLPAFGYLPDVISATPEAGDATDDSLLDQLDSRCRMKRRRLWVTTFRQWLSRLRPGGSRPRTAPTAPPKDAGAGTARPAGGDIRETRRFRIYWAIVWRLYWYVDWCAPVLLTGALMAMRRRYELVWVSGPHSRNMFAGYWLSRLLRKPLVLDIRDPWTYGSLWAPATRDVDHAERKWARRILRRAARIVFTSPLTMEEMQRRFPEVAPDRMCVITNGYSADTVVPIRETPADVCLFRYVGSLNERRRPDIILQGLRLARERNAELARDVRFEFIGGMAGHEAGIAEFDLEAVVTNVGRVTHEDSLRMIHGADVNVLLQTISEGQDVVSGKAFEYLAARKPILAVVSETGGDAWLVREARAGIVTPFDDAESVARAIESCWQSWKSGAGELTMSDERLEKFSRRHLTRDLARVLDDVVSN